MTCNIPSSELMQANRVFVLQQPISTALEGIIMICQLQRLRLYCPAGCRGSTACQSGQYQRSPRVISHLSVAYPSAEVRETMRDHCDM